MINERYSVTGDFAQGGGATIDKSVTVNLVVNIQMTQEVVRNDANFIETLISKLRGMIDHGINTRTETIPVLDIQGSPPSGTSR